MRGFDNTLSKQSRKRVMAFCAYCGKELLAGAGFCPSCGKPVTVAGPSAVPTLMPGPVPAQPYAQTETRPNYASGVERSLAALIDLIIVAVAAFIVLFPIGFSRFFFVVPGLYILVFWLLLIVYGTYFDTTTGRSIGKDLFGIRTVDETTLKPLDFERSLVRNLFRIIDILPIFYIIGTLVIVLDRRKRRLGDIAARSIVIKG
jgi:uncharacterized RDD family membrane protein YckC